MSNFNYKDYPLDTSNPVHPSYLCITKRWYERPNHENVIKRPVKLKLKNGKIKEFESLTDAGRYVGYKDIKSSNTALKKAAAGATAAGWFTVLGKKYKLIEGIEE